jgi:hypothetical protein
LFAYASGAAEVVVVAVLERQLIIRLMQVLVVAGAQKPLIIFKPLVYHRKFK